MKKFFPFILMTLLVIMCANLKGQETKDSTLTYRLTLEDGNIFIGTIISKDSSSVYFMTSNLGQIRIQRSDIKSIEIVEATQVRGGKVWYPNLQSTRYFFAPNGYGQRKGEVYYQNVWVLYNQVSAGLTNNISLGAGIVPLFLFAGAPTPVWVMPKISVPIVKNKFNVGAGALIGGVLGVEKSLFGIAYGVTTVGSRDANATFGLGYGFVSKGWAKKPLVNFSFFVRVSPKTYFISENYYLPIDDEAVLILSLGARSIIRRVGIDYGLFLPIIPDADFYFAIPWLGLTVPLHKSSLDKKHLDSLK